MDGVSYVLRPGGAPIYSGLGVTKAGGIAGGYVSIGEDFNFDLPDYISIIEKVIFKKTMRFLLEFKEGTRKLTLKHGHGPIPIVEQKLKGWNGVILNPVCGEIPPSIDVSPLPVAVDIQGFVRNCVEGEEIVINRKFNYRVSSDLSIFHANTDEITASGVTVDELKDYGFNEIIISNGYNGFTLYTKEDGKTVYTPSVRGGNEVGNGDFLLASYFTLRLNGEDTITAARNSLKLAESFSILGQNVLTRSG
ncbi:hypothetical protein DFR87_06015 [Metallosphaera hakonensis JCM 8857 = DSM 7519]|uniref:Carbohydrate kinase PfkB domain-containing protein n=2 Tax=Metallosphaera hakonensis TaxID=79601 RepID=A0A2U9IX49_9CREN|nr:hypothetical protein DFR87_06015 [Metallosphaera hakonensis JCM 8857 = DSM 7519]